MKLGLDTIAGLGADGNDKQKVLDALFATKDRHSVLGTYGFDENGDTTLTSYGLYKVGSDGNPVFDKTTDAARIGRIAVRHRYDRLRRGRCGAPSITDREEGTRGSQVHDGRACRPGRRARSRRSARPPGAGA